MQQVVERTQQAATIMRDNQGNDLYEQLSATEDNVWMLDRYIESAWQEIVELCRAYIYCQPTITDSDEVTRDYTIVLLMPQSWDVVNAITIDKAIEEYMVSQVTTRWWISKGVSEQATIEAERASERKSEIKYTLNSRRRTRDGRPISYI